jgi:hypothetical protein
LGTRVGSFVARKSRGERGALLKVLLTDAEAGSRTPSTSTEFITHVSLGMVSLAIEELPAVIKEDVEDFLENYPLSPAARLRPRMGMVGDIWLAFIGPEVRRGASGLGETPRDALKDFNRHFMEPLVSRNGSEPAETD